MATKERASSLHGRRQEALAKWKKKFVEGADYDNWGQQVEAAEIYEYMSNEISDEIQLPQLHYSDADMVILRKILSAIELRCSSMQSADTRDNAMTVSEIKALATAFRNWNEGLPLPEVSKVALPEVSAARSMSRRQSEMQVDDDEDEDEDDQFGHGKRGESDLVAKPSFGPGKTLLTIRLEKIGLKDAPEHVSPFFTISVKDTAGKDVAALQTTATASQRSNLYLEFNMDVYMDIPVEDFPDNAAIFFELHHYKLKKGKSSTKCFSFLEKDEIKEGQTVLEIYRKPTNFKRKRLNLLTVKPLYLHLTLTLA